MIKSLVFFLVLFTNIQLGATESLQIKAVSLKIGQETFEHQVFIDEYGREAYFRGFNVSGSVKLKDNNFLPFKKKEDAAESLETLKMKTGRNIIRLTLAWEGVHPEVDKIDEEYLESFVAQIKEATSRKIYVLLDYHQDLFSRHLFNKDDYYTGNGAPQWITEDIQIISCGLLCLHWAQNNLTNAGVREAFRSFWNNKTINTEKGERKVQDEYLWQLSEVLRYVKKNLSLEDFHYILGVDPFNEPVDGGMEKLSPQEWDNQKLWPFYKRVRLVLDNNGWIDKLVFAEPLVFWNVDTLFVPKTGGQHLKQRPGKGFVFNSHFYDTSRMGISFSSARSGEYFSAYDEIRDEANFLSLPPFVSEFGMWIDGKGAKDSAKMIKANYQALDVSANGKRSKIFSPFVSATQWHWDYYYDNHHEFINGNLEKLITEKDAWNDENFSVIKDYAQSYTIDKELIERAYPRRVQGNLLSFYANDLSTSSKGKELKWAYLGSDDKRYLSDTRFVFMTWFPKKINAPSKIYIPGLYFAQSIVMTQDRVCLFSQILLGQCSPLSMSKEGNGWNLMLNYSKDKQDIHYLVVLEKGNKYLKEIKNLLDKELVTNQKSPLFFK